MGMRLLGLAGVIFMIGCTHPHPSPNPLRIMVSESTGGGFTHKMYCLVEKKCLENLGLTENDAAALVNTVYTVKLGQAAGKFIAGLVISDEKPEPTEGKPELLFSENPAKEKALQQLIREGIRVQHIRLREGRREVVADYILKQ